MVSLLAMVALAIDLTTLYVAKAEIQRAADTVALAGAKAFVDSGVTTYPTNVNLQAVAQSIGNAYLAAAVKQNSVEGSPANLVGSATYNFNQSGNPSVSVTLQKTDLPLFFARIWGNSSASVSADAIAEAYNPAYSQSNTGTLVPTAPKCVKPFLMANSDPNQSGSPPFVDITTGLINTNAGVQPFIGEQITLTSACQGGNPFCQLRASSPAVLPGEYLPMLTGIHQYCPASGSCPGGGDFEKSIDCCDGTAFNFAQCGSGTAVLAPVNPDAGPNFQARNGLQCLIHTSATGSGGPDSLNLTNFLSGTGPIQVLPGSFSQGRYGVSGNLPIATSDSIITVPLFDNTQPVVANGPVTIVGFLQLFISSVTPPSASNAPDANAYILNVVGCGNNIGTTVVSGGGVSPIPVRLIHN
jgi:hypothetical protein